jgi:PKD domain
MLRIRVLTLPLLAALLLPGAASAAAGDPYVIYTANNYADGAVIVRTDPVAGTAVEISRNGPQGNLFQRPYDLALDAGGDLLVADMGTVCNETRCAEDGRIIRVDSLTGVQSLVAEGDPLVDPAGLAVAPGGDVYVADNYAADNNGAVIRVNPTSGAKTVVSERGNLDLPFGILVDRDGSLVVSNRAQPGVCVPAVSGNLVRVRPADGSQQVLSSGGLFSYPLGVALDTAGQIVFANECGATGLARLAGNLTQALATNSPTDLLVTPERMALDPAGNFLVSDWSLGDGDGGIVGVDAATGGQRLVRQGELFNHPLGIAAVVSRPPVAALDVPRRVAAGERVTLDASRSSDPEKQRLLYEWDFNGDGVYERGTGSVATTTRAWARDGRVTVCVRVNDRHGAHASVQSVMRIDGSTPRITRVKTDARVLAAAPRGRAAKKPPRSARLRFRLSEAAAVTVTIRRAARGRRAGKAKVFERDGQAGANSLLLRARGRRPGSYRLVIEAVDAVGHEATPRRLGVRIVRRPAAARR